MSWKVEIIVEGPTEGLEEKLAQIKKSVEAAIEPTAVKLYLTVSDGDEEAIGFTQ